VCDWDLFHGRRIFLLAIFEKGILGGNMRVRNKVYATRQIERMSVTQE